MKIIKAEEIEIGKMRVTFDDGSERDIARGDDYSDLDQETQDFLLMALLPPDIEVYRESINQADASSSVSNLPAEEEFLTPLERMARGLD